ncbi:aminotransferase class IV family protein [Kibdelosporangium phytohabitans]|uniref:Branched-chain amino acid aminotransferase n=1 Tax=Kibdelosporangium phytohabitans TaxID=860235 RepID=A0A0N9IKT8_9PSEU|nr:aminotransferase class IV family protein [Kibdelosporangium phytohabitans]ALG15689.1 branched-chain amino acid aminotransferase [Kibdelosporangium phytohabitans]MBE1466890.1 branched-subunit amino acid aminotransferase/4-amino-4-deoxychorismate lyase [Kibdelosporangium phytohabitans]
MTSFVVQRNSRTAAEADLAPLAFAGYAHLTAMQVRDRQVKGLDLHLERLRTASVEMFGTALPDEQVLADLGAAIDASPADASLVAVVYSTAGEFTAAEPDLQTLVRTSPPATGPQGPLALAAYEHERVVPAVKHVGEMAKTYYLREAVRQGFDDAAFTDRHGRISEATIWNLAFWDGSSVIWPDAAYLVGITMRIVQRQLEKLGVPQRFEEITDPSRYSGAVVMNSWTPGIAVNRIGDARIPGSASFLDILHRAYDAEPFTTCAR